jgi:hypothetical protein
MSLGSCRWRSLVLVLTIVVHLPALVAVNGDPPESPTPEVFDVLHFGNSYTAQYPWAIDYLANAADKQHDFFMVGAAGVPIRHFWFNESLKKRAVEALQPQHKWDALILQHYSNTGSVQDNIDSNLPAAIRTAELAWQANPQCQVFIYQIWPRYADWDNPPPARQPAVEEGIAAGLTAWKNEHMPEAPDVKVIPVGLAVMALGELIDDNQIPEVTDKLTIYKDGGHLNPDVGGYVMVMTHLACLYKEHPRIYGHEPLYRDSGNRDGKPVFTTQSTLAKRIQDIVWEVVWNYPHSGVNPDLVIGTRSLPPAIDGLLYEQTLIAGNGVEPFTWEVAAGNLPAGITLEPKGLLRGTPEGMGEQALTLRVSDAKGRDARREYTLQVQPDSSPAISTEQLPVWHQGAWSQTTLQAESGNPPLTWSVAPEQLPVGMELTSSGILRGDPGAVGAYPLSITVSDADATGAESDTVQLTLQVAEALANTLVAPHALQPPLIDGFLQDSAWEQPGQPIAKAAVGEWSGNASFKTAWDAQALYVAVAVEAQGWAAGPTLGTIALSTQPQRGCEGVS